MGACMCDVRTTWFRTVRCKALGQVLWSLVLQHSRQIRKMGIPRCRADAMPRLSLRLLLSTHPVAHETVARRYGPVKKIGGPSLITL